MERAKNRKTLYVYVTFDIYVLGKDVQLEREKERERKKRK